MIQINILFIIVIVCAVIKLKYGFEEGFSKGLYRIVVTFVSAIVIFEIVKGMKGAFEHQTYDIVRAVLSLLIILVIYKIINLPLTSLKLMSKTPGLHMLDKIVGAMLGVLECVLTVWVVFVVIDYIKYEPVTRWIIEQANGNTIVSLLYNKNYVKELILKLVLIKQIN